MIIDNSGTLEFKTWATLKALNRLLRAEVRIKLWYLFFPKRQFLRTASILARAFLSEWSAVISKVRSDSILYATSLFLSSYMKI